MRVADKIYTSLLQRQARPKETGDKPGTEFPKRESLQSGESRSPNSSTASGGDSLDALSHPAVRTLDALIRDRVLAFARKEGDEPQAEESGARLSQLADSMKQATKADRDEVMHALLQREDALMKASEQNATLLGEVFRDFLR